METIILCTVATTLVVACFVVVIAGIVRGF